MSVRLISNLLDKLNKITFGDNNIVYSINLVLTHTNIYFFIIYSKREWFTVKTSHFHLHAYIVTLALARFNVTFIYSANDVTSKCYECCFY
jgi:hypothetical protein